MSCRALRLVDLVGNFFVVGGVVWSVDFARSDIERAHSGIVAAIYPLENLIYESLHYPWAIAPTINTTKPVATAIATFVSIDKFMISPFNYGGDRVAPRFFLFQIFEFQCGYGCQARCDENTRMS